MALELDMDATQDLLGRAGLTLSRSSTFDMIVRFFIERGIYDLFQLMKRCSTTISRSWVLSKRCRFAVDHTPCACR